MKLNPFYLGMALAGTLGLVASCGTLGAVADAVETAQGLEDYEDRAQSAADLLQERLDQTQAAVDAYAPIMEGASEEVQEAYAKVQELLSDGQSYLAEGRELLTEAKSVHEQALAAATDPDTGETDWLEYALLLLAGGGGLASERRRTAKERDRMHERVDSEKSKRQEIEAALARLQQQVELEQARRGSAS